MRASFVPVLLAISVLAAPGHALDAFARGQHAFRDAELRGMRGVTVGPIESSQWPGRGYGTAYSAALLDELARLGTTWISITPFGRVWSLQSTEVRWDFEAPYADNRAAVVRMVEQAHARGLKVLLIPHLWVETGGWRGEMDPGSPARWAAYLASFGKFVRGWADVAAETHADAFSIGVECKSFSGRFGGFWRTLIRDVRARYPGLLTYSANWDEMENVLFWDALDFIGINAFFPLAHHNDASFAEYREGAERARTLVERTSRIVDRPVVFVEVGYTTRENAAVEPWLWPDEMADVRYDEDEQARALAAILGAFLPEPWFGGLFVWRYYASLDDVSQEDAWGFSPHGKPAEAVLSSAFRSVWGVDSAHYPYANY